jgi:RHS repeat-associated protein
VTKPFTPVNITTTYTYDLVGNLLTTKAADNVVTSTRTYDALNRLLTDKDGKNQTISYAYDALGRMTSYTDAKGATFAFAYDLLGRLVQRTEPDTTWQSYTYDVAGRFLVHRKADGKTKTHIYGDPDRDFLTRVDYSNGEPSRLMEYDRLGRMTSAANPDLVGASGGSTVTRTYDAAGRLTSETQALAGGPTGSFVYEYNTATDDGNLKKHTRPDGSQIDYAWNARNLLDSVTSDGPPPVATYSYNARNQIASTVVESGLFTATRSYDTAGRLDGITHAGIVETTGYDLSPDGRRTGITRNGDTESYGYDNARQVTSGTYGGLSTTQSWNYDPAGNRLTAVTNGSTTTYQANAVNEYFSITGGGHVPPAPTYDDNGNATTWNVQPLLSPGLLSSVFEWNINNELTSATNASGDSATYAYDALGRRVKRTETIGGTTTTTWFFYNGWNVELEHSGSTYTRRLTWGLDLSNSLQGAGGVGGLVMVEHLPPLPLGEGGGEGASGLAEAYFPTFDGNGNITAWVDATATVIARQRYDAFGNILLQTGTAPSNYAFSTKPQERVTGLYYYGYRFYDPVTGRWINRDPIEESGGVNLYGFVESDSPNQYDLLGFQSLQLNEENPLRPNPLPLPKELEKVPSTGLLKENRAQVGYISGNCLGFALRDYHRIEKWNESNWELALKYVPPGCRKVPCEGVDARNTRCRDGQCDVIVFLALSKAGTPHFHAMGRKVGTDYAWNTVLLHAQKRERDNRLITGGTPVESITDPLAHVKEYFPRFSELTPFEKICFCCKCRDDKSQ